MNNFGFEMMEDKRPNCCCCENKRPEKIFCKKECKCKCFKMVETECPKCCCEKHCCER